VDEKTGGSTVALMRTKTASPFKQHQNDTQHGYSGNATDTIHDLMIIFINKFRALLELENSVKIQFAKY